jgi:hypothetical protein
VDKSFTSVIIRDESETFAVVEPLYCSISHYFYLLIRRFKFQKVSVIKKATKSKVFVASAAKTSKILSLV